jgi:hypothetical protein
MVELTQKQFKQVAEIVATAARLSEIKRWEGFVPSAALARRKRALKLQLSKLTDKKEEKEETTVNIRLEIPEQGKTTSKKEKSFAVSVGNILKGKFNEVEVDDNDDEENIFAIVKSLLPYSGKLGGKIVTEL